MIDQLDYCTTKTIVQSNVVFIKDALNMVQYIGVRLFKDYFLMGTLMIPLPIPTPQFIPIFTITLEACFHLLVFPKPILVDYSPLLQAFSIEFLIVKNDGKVIPNYVECGTMENKFLLFVV